MNILNLFGPQRNLYNTVNDGSGHDIFDGLSINAFSKKGKVTTAEILSQSTCFTCMSLKADIISQLPWNVYYKTPDGNYYKLDEIPREYRISTMARAVARNVQKLLMYPNDHQDGSEFKKNLVLHYEAQGNSYVYKDESRGMMFLIDPDQVKVSADSRGGAIYKLQTSLFGIPEKTLEPRLICHLKDIETNGLVGESRYSKSSDLVRIAISLDRFANYLLDRGIAVDLLYKLPAEMPTKDKLYIEQLKSNIRSQFQAMVESGPDKSSVLILEGGAEVQRLEPTKVTDAELNKLNELVANRIAALSKVPPNMIGGATTFNNTAQNNVQFFKDAIMPIIHVIEQKMTHKMFMQVSRNEPNERQSREIGQFCIKFDYEDHLKGDRTQQISNTTRLVTTGVLTPNEARLELGFNAVDDDEANKLHIKTNNTTDDDPARSPQDTGGGGNPNGRER